MKRYYLDTESTLDGEFLVGVLYDVNNDKYEVFFSSLSMYERIRNIDGCIYAHSGISFDYLFLVPHITKKDVFRITYVGSRPFSYCLNRARLYDTIFMMPSSLEKLAKEFQLQKEAVDYEHIERYSREELAEKCKQHAELLSVIHQLFYNFFGLTPYRCNSIAGLSHILLSKKYGLQNTEMPMLNDSLREFYMGGRCEIFKMKANKVNIYDVNSMYPYAMKQVKYYTNYRIVVTSKIKENTVGIYGKFIQDRYIPVIPTKVKKRFSSEMVFYNGARETLVWRPEFELLKDSEIQKIYYTIEGEGEPIVFSEFVDEFFKLKQSKNPLLYKLLLNSSYGKFSQYYQLRFAENRLLRDKTIQSKISYENIDLFEYIENSRYKFENIPYSACVTSFSRAYLYRFFEKAGLETIVYCDTDSIFTTSRLQESDNLGGLKLEGENGEFEAIQPKVYMWKGSQKSKIKAKGIKDIDEEKFRFLALGYQIENRRYKGVKEVLRSGSFSITQIKKSLQKQYDKRWIQGDGVSTLPRSYDEELPF